jgi:purine-nucleoside phosphorylase
MAATEHFNTYRQAAAYLLERLAGSGDESMFHPQIGIICGSGLSELSSCMENTISVSYSDIPGFPAHTTVQGHKNSCVLGYLHGVPAICFRGRFHFYEGHDMNTVALPVRTMRAMGVKLVFVTNAAGGLNPNYSVGDIVCIMDHVALPMLSGRNPLVGPNDPDLGPRFPPTSNAYDPKLQSLVLESASRLGLKEKVKKDGVYCFVSGPMYESKAECRFLRSVGGDAVGMSTVRGHTLGHQ